MSVVIGIIGLALLLVCGILGVLGWLVGDKGLETYICYILALAGIGMIVYAIMT